MTCIWFSKFIFRTSRTWFQNISISTEKKSLWWVLDFMELLEIFEIPEILDVFGISVFSIISDDMYLIFKIYFSDESRMISKYFDFDRKKKFMVSSWFYGTFGNIWNPRDFRCFRNFSISVFSIISIVSDRRRKNMKRLIKRIDMNGRCLFMFLVEFFSF